MTETQSLPLRLAAIAAWVLLAAGCASAPVEGGSSLPDPVIVNDPPAEPVLDETELPAPLPIPEQSAPVDDMGPPEPIVYGDVFDRIRKNLSLPDSEHRRVQSEIAWMQRNPEYFARTMDRAQRYMHFIVDEVEKRGMPGGPRAAAHCRERLQPVRVFAQSRGGPLAIHRIDRRTV